jgi:hypothetical protein
LGHNLLLHIRSDEAPVKKSAKFPKGHTTELIVQFSGRQNRDSEEKISEHIEVSFIIGSIFVPSIQVSPFLMISNGIQELKGVKVS